jgi:hypothetical protein
MGKTVLIIGTLDTKGAEIGYLRDRLQARLYELLAEQLAEDA